MVLPLPSERPSMPIETPVAAPVTTIWNDSNSFCAAAMAAAVGAFATGWTPGRIFWAAGATHTCAVLAEPAINAVAATAKFEGSQFMKRLLGCLVPGTAGVSRPGWATQEACGFF